MQWTDGKNRGFSDTDGELYLPVDETPSSPDVARQQADEHSLLNTVRAAVKFRKENEDLHAVNNLELVYAEENAYPFVFRRGKFLIAVNPRAERAEAPVPAGRYTEAFRVNGGASVSEGKLAIDGVTLVAFRQEE